MYLVTQVWNLTIKIPLMNMQVKVTDFEHYHDYINCQVETTSKL